MLLLLMPTTQARAVCVVPPAPTLLMIFWASASVVLKRKSRPTESLGGMVPAAKVGVCFETLVAWRSLTKSASVVIFLKSLLENTNAFVFAKFHGRA